jgi:ribosomal protein L37AE/L43A
MYPIPGRKQMKYEIEISTDKQKCTQCGKLKKGCYRQKNNNWICTKCIFENIEIRSSNNNKTVEALIGNEE